MNKIVIVTLLSLTLVAAYAVDKAPASDKQNSSSQFMIGILRANGTVVPFAEYGNGGWWNPWPKPPQTAESIYAESTEVTHHSLADLSEPWFKQCGKIPTTWFFWSSAGTATVLRATNIVQATAHSGINWALLTDFPKRISEDPLHDVIGIAVTVRQEIEPIIEIKTASPEGKDIASFIKQILNDDETAEIERMRAERSPAMPDLPLVFSLASEELLR